MHEASKAAGMRDTAVPFMQHHIFAFQKALPFMAILVLGGTVRVQTSKC